ncbi:cysteinyl-tRNA synthetase, partial [Pelagibacteraceae bacterium GOM-A3]
ELDKPKIISDDDLHPLYDDLNTPMYIANLHKLYEKSQSGNIEDKKEFVSACNFIGLLIETKDQWINFKKNKSSLNNELIEIKIKERNQARDDKNYELADKIRNDLLEKGVQIEDKDGKTSWKFK